MRPSFAVLAPLALLVVASFPASAGAGEREVLHGRTTDEVHDVETPTLCCSGAFLTEADYADVRLDVACPGGVLAVQLVHVRDDNAPTFRVGPVSGEMVDPEPLANVPCADGAATVALPDFPAGHVYAVEYHGVLLGPGVLSYAVSGVRVA